ncbi:MAG: hypothetical protein FJW22_05140 [Acidimicrobiia bacterium]|nr:hypothetical protein [Acidimicrobiia bacterium]
MSSPTSTGVDARLASVLCYAGWWVTGLVFLFAERRNSTVRFHAAQSLLVFGPITVALFLSGGASAIAFFVAAPTFQTLQALGNAIWFAAVFLWLLLLLKTWRGEDVRLPVAGAIAMKIGRFLN